MLINLEEKRTQNTPDARQKQKQKTERRKYDRCLLSIFANAMRKFKIFLWAMSCALGSVLQIGCM